MFKLILGALLVMIGVGSMFWGCALAVATALGKETNLWDQLLNSFFIFGVVALFIGAMMCGWEKE